MGVVPRSIAVAQTCPVKGDVDANLEDHLRLAGCAASEGAQLVLFPELSLTGYEIGLADRLAFSENDPRITPLADLAVSRNIIVIAGAPVRLGARLHVGAFIIGPDRTISLYTKRRMGAFSEAARCDGVVPPAEATVFQPGDRDPLVHFAGQTGAMAICADVGQPSHPQRAAERGAGTYLASMFVIPSEFEADSLKLRGYAVEHAMVVAAANYGSATGGLAAAGRSSIWAATGDLLIRLDDAGAGVAIATELAGGWRTTVAGLDTTRQHAIGGEAAWR
jgi:predicted amidohydrolase